MRKRIHQARDPADHARLHTFHNRIVHAHQNLQPITQQRPNRRHPPNVGAGLFDGLQIWVVSGEDRDLFGHKIGAIRGRIVVQHCGQIRRRDHCVNVRLHFAPIGGIHVRRQHHQAATAQFGGGLRQLHRFRSRKRGDAGNDWHAVADCAQRRFEQRGFFAQTKRRTFAERSQRHNANTTSVHQPATMGGEKLVINAAVGVEWGGDGGNNPAPVHVHDKTFLMNTILPSPQPLSLTG